MPSDKVKTFELRKNTKEELKAKLLELKGELATLRVQQATQSQSAKVAKIHTVRKNIARVLTVINQSQRNALRTYYVNKRAPLPLDLRHKKTRAIRRRLSKEDAARVTERTAKRIQHFSQRKYAVLA